MKQLIKLALFLLVTSCSNQTSTESEIIAQFEQILGNSETRKLDQIVDDFDQFLSAHYPGKEDKFQTYLNEITESKNDAYWKVDSVQLQLYRQSRLFNLFKEVYPDSVRYDGNSFTIFYGEYGSSELIPIASREDQKSNFNIDSTVRVLMNKPEQMLVEIGRFYLAIDSVSNSDSLISEYWKAKDASHRMPTNILARGLAHSMNEQNEYFAKRIFIIENLEK